MNHAHIDQQAHHLHADVAAGKIDGDVRVSGHPKVQKTFARVMGYVEQSDIHSPWVSIML